MARSSNVLTGIKDAFNSFDNVDVFYSNLKCDENKLLEFISIFSNIEDTRMDNKCTYSTMTIVGIVFFGLLFNMDTWIEIEAFAREKKNFIGKFVDLSNGVPSHDTLERVFSLINSTTLEDALVDFIRKSIEATARILEVTDNGTDLLAIDGKELNGTGRKYGSDEKTKNVQIMHFYYVSTGVCIRSQLIEEKTNEIPTAQKVLTALNIKDLIITSDAMNCQKETVAVISDGKAHYVLGLKGNHGDFHNEIVDKFASTNKYNKGCYYKMETEKNHNQVEIREYYMISAKKFVFSEGWKNIKNVVMYKKTTTNNITGEEKIERRYYITDLKDLELIALSARRHWAVENELHWHMDASLNEDANKTVNRNAINNLSIMKKNILTILKLLQPLFGNRSIKLVRKLFTINYELNIMKLFTLLDEESIKELIKAK